MSNKLEFLYILFFNYAAFKLCAARNIDTASEVFSSQLKRGDILFSRYRIVEKLHQSDPTSGYNNAASLRFRQRAFSSSAIQPLDELPERTAGRFRVPEFQLPGLDAGPKKLGQGGFGAIYLATDSQTGGGFVSVKVPVRVSSEREAAEIRKEVEDEAKMLEAAWAACGASHGKHLLELIEKVRGENGELILITPYYEEGTLAQHVRGHGKPQKISLGKRNRAIRRFVPQIAGVIHCLATNDIVHRDVKGDNVLLYKAPDGALQAVLIDFGLAKKIPSSVKPAGTPRFLPPEIMGSVGRFGPDQPAPLSQTNDSWALGILILEMLGIWEKGLDYTSPQKIALRRRLFRPDFSWQDRLEAIQKYVGRKEETHCPETDLCCVEYENDTGFRRDFARFAHEMSDFELTSKEKETLGVYGHFFGIEQFMEGIEEAIDVMESLLENGILQGLLSVSPQNRSLQTSADVHSSLSREMFSRDHNSCWAGMREDVQEMRKRIVARKNEEQKTLLEKQLEKEKRDVEQSLKSLINIAKAEKDCRLLQELAYIKSNCSEKVRASGDSRAVENCRTVTLPADADEALRDAICKRAYAIKMEGRLFGSKEPQLYQCYFDSSSQSCRKNLSLVCGATTIDDLFEEEEEKRKFISAGTVNRLVENEVPKKIQLGSLDPDCQNEPEVAKKADIPGAASLVRVTAASGGFPQVGVEHYRSPSEEAMALGGEPLEPKPSPLQSKKISIERQEEDIHI